MGCSAFQGCRSPPPPPPPCSQPSDCLHVTMETLVAIHQPICAEQEMFKRESVYRLCLLSGTRSGKLRQRGKGKIQHNVAFLTHPTQHNALKRERCFVDEEMPHSVEYIMADLAQSVQVEVKSYLLDGKLIFSLFFCRRPTFKSLSQFHASCPVSSGHMTTM